MSNPFETPNEDQWFWQTQSKFFAPSEKELLSPLFSPTGGRFLEVGCGDGGNLFHLKHLDHTLKVGVEISLGRVGFASRQLHELDWVCGDGKDLPFESNSFEHVLVRDVLHHVGKKERLVDEVIRVLSPGGRALFLEPNGRNPIMGAWALAARFDRGILRNRPKYLKDLLEREEVVQENMYYLQPLPLRRVVFHYRFGIKAPGRIVEKIVSGIERLGSWLMPKGMYGYIGVELKKRS